MPKTEISDYDENDAGNTDISGIVLSDATFIDALDNIARAQMGALKRWFKSSLFRLRDSTDQTKLLAFDLSGLPTATTVTQKVPAAQQTFGQCRLALDGSNIRLFPYGGSLLTIDGYGQKIPSAGVALAPTGLTVSTKYYVYAYMSGATMTLEASATGHSIDATTGVEIKTGDATRSLVGMVYVGTGPAFNDSALKRHVVSWFNRKEVLAQGVLLTAVSIGPTSYVPIASSSLQQSLLVWLGQTVEVSLTGAVAHDTAGVISTAATLDATLLDLGVVHSVATINSPLTCCSARAFDVGYEGLATFDMVGKISSGTGSWLGSTSPDPARITLSCKAA